MIQKLTFLIALLGSLGFASAQNAWRVFSPASSPLPHANCHHIDVDSAGAVWIATSGGVAHFREGAPWGIYQLPNTGILPNFLAAVDVAGDGTLWAGAFSNGVSAFRNGNWSAEYSGNIKDVFLDSRGEVWAATTTGLGHYGGTSWETFSAQNTSFFPSTVVNCVIEDSVGNIWVGTDPNGNLIGGFVRYNGSSWTNYSSLDGLPDNRVRALAFDAQGILWLGTQSGVVAWNQQSWQTFDASNSGLPDNRVNTLAVDEDGLLWVGTEGGLATFDGSTWTAFTKTNSDLPDNRVRSLGFDLTGHTWMATGNGVAVYRSAGVTTDLEGPGSPAMDLFPNPVQRLAPLSLSQPQASHGQFALFDLQGRRVWEQAVPAQPLTELIVPSYLAPGWYSYRWHNEQATKQGKLLLR